MIGKTIGPYRILKELGAGGMGRVYLVLDVRLGRQVALKILDPKAGIDADAKRRFSTEARAAAALSHPHILAIYDVGESDGLVFIAMEYVEGGTLRERIVESGTFPCRTTAGIGAQLASALARAHEAGIIHRDIKPENIKLSRDGQVKILDFGLAKLMEAGSPAADSSTDSLTRTVVGRVLGSPHYMSPEQARGAAVDGRSDLFSLGSVLYEMTTGSTPFPGESLIEVLHAIIHDSPPPLRRSAPEAPAELERILHKCLEKDPADRYQHADDLTVDLRRVQSRLDADADSSRESPLAGDHGERGTTATAVPKSQEATPTVGLAMPQSAVHSRVALFLFDNETTCADHDWLEHAIPALIGFSLRQDPCLDASWGCEYGYMREAGLSRASDLPLPVLRKIAEDANYGYFVVGSLRSIDDGLSVSATLYLTRNARQIAELALQAKSIEGVPALADSLCAWLRQSLGMSLDHVEEVPCLPVAEIATRSTNALRAFTEGEIAVGLRQDWSEGIRLLQRAVTEDPRFAWAELHLQVALLVANRGEESKAVLRSLMKNRDRLPERDQFRAALAYHRIRQEPERALGVARRWTELYPHDPDAVIQLAHAHGFLGQGTEELEALTKACRLAPERPVLLLDAARHLKGRGRNDEALSFLTEYVENCPKAPEAMALMGEVLHGLARFDEARAQYEKALLIGPDQIGARIGLANLDRDLGRFAEGLAQYESALEDAETAEQRATIHESLSSLFLVRGQVARAIEHFEEALAERATFMPRVSVFVRRIATLPLYIMAGRAERAQELLAILNRFA